MSDLDKSPVLVKMTDFDKLQIVLKAFDADMLKVKELLDKVDRMHDDIMTFGHRLDAMDSAINDIFAELDVSNNAFCDDSDIR